MNKTTSKLLTITACFSFVLFSGEETYSQNDLSIVKVATERPAMQPIRVGNVSSKSNFTSRQDDDLLKNLQKAEDDELTEALGGDDIADLFKAGQWPRK